MHGTEAIDYLEGTGVYQDRVKYPFPDLMVLDLNMPQMDGFEVLRRLHGKFPKVKVGVFTTSDDAQDQERALALGAHLYQQKTYEPDKFIRFLEWLGKLAAADERLITGTPHACVGSAPGGAMQSVPPGLSVLSG